MTLAIALKNVWKTYPGGPRAVAGVTLEVAAGSVLALLGPSGCGKTTLLRLIAGLERPDQGVIQVGERTVAGEGVWVAPEQRRVGLVFQEGALFPHLTVAENIGFALNGRPRRAREQRVAALLALVGLEGLGSRYPHQLSGGQQQRVALARALAPEPAVVLLDEPFASLDPALRGELREEVMQILRAAATTTVLVTHDQEEALSLADQIALMLDGRVVQHASPFVIYDRPATRAVADFIGAANWLPGHAEDGCARCALGIVPLAAPVQGPVDVLVRPEQLCMAPDPAGAWRVQEIRFFGHDTLVTLVGDTGLLLRARRLGQAHVSVGTFVQLQVCGAVSAFPREQEP